MNVCAANALACHFFHTFTEGNRVFPVPHTDWQAYLDTPLFAVRGQPITYEVQVLLPQRHALLLCFMPWPSYVAWCIPFSLLRLPG